MKTDKGETFYTRPYALWALLTSVVAVVTVGGIALDLAQGDSLAAILAHRGLSATACIGLSYCLSGLVSRLLPVSLSKQGIRSYTIFGVYHSVDWAEIESVEAVSIVGIRYARIHRRSGGSSLWIPAFLINRDRFLAQIRQHSAHSDGFESAFFGQNHSLPAPSHQAS